MLSKFSIPETVKSEILAIAPETLLAHGVITLAKDGKSYCCPFCDNGTKEKGDGLKPDYQGGALLWHCFSCNTSFNNIQLLAHYYGLDARAEFVEVCRRACEDFGIYLEVEKERKMTAKDLIKADIDTSQGDNLEKLLDSDGKWLGLTLDTLRLYHCKYIADWTNTTSRLKGYNATPTPRLLIPSGEHYLARLTVPIETFDNAPDRKFIKDKPHEGTKHPFAAEFITADAQTITFVEGEIDAMSINQVFGTQYRVAIATLGAAVAQNVEKEIFDVLENVFAATDKKPYILILFDNDKAGRTNAPKLCQEFIKRGYPAVVDFFSYGDEKVDANKILLEQGDDGLRQAVTDIFKRNAQNFEDAVQTIATKKADDSLNPSALFLTDEQYRKIFRDLSGTNDLANARRFAYILKNLLGDRVRYLSDCDRWANFNHTDGTWHINSNSKNTALNSEISKAADILAANAKTSSDREVAAAFANQRKYSPAITTMKYHSAITISTEDFNRHKYLLNCQNCVVDLQTGKTYQHAPCIDIDGTPQLSTFAHFSKIARADFISIDYHDETLDKFLREVQPDEQSRAALLRFFGYAITGECREEKFLFMDGTGGNGKGTFTGLIMAIVNNYGCSFPIEGILLNSKIDANAATTAYNMLLGTRVAMSEEIPPNVKLNPAKIKLLTGGDRIPIRKMFEEYSVIEDPTHTMIFSGNNLPEIGDVHDPGILRRLQRIIFAQDFRQRADPNLKKKLLEPSCRSAMLAYLVREAMEWYNTVATGKSGLIESAEMKAAVNQYISSQDFISEFISEHCTRGKNLKIARKEFLKALQDEYPKETRGQSDQSLTRTIEKIDGIFYRRGTGGGYAFFGIGWNDVHEQQTLLDNDKEEVDVPF